MRLRVDILKTYYYCLPPRPIATKLSSLFLPSSSSHEQTHPFFPRRVTHEGNGRLAPARHVGSCSQRRRQRVVALVHRHQPEFALQHPVAACNSSHRCTRGLQGCTRARIAGHRLALRIISAGRDKCISESPCEGREERAAGRNSVHVTVPESTATHARGVRKEQLTWRSVPRRCSRDLPQN